MRRVIACLGLLAIVLGWCVDDPLQQRVSYDKPAQTLKALLRDLSARTNLKLYAAPPLDTEIVLVAVQEMPLKELMEHLERLSGLIVGDALLQRLVYAPAQHYR